MGILLFSSWQTMQTYLLETVPACLALFQKNENLFPAPGVGLQRWADLGAAAEWEAAGRV